MCNYFFHSLCHLLIIKIWWRPWDTSGFYMIDFIKSMYGAGNMLLLTSNCNRISTCLIPLHLYLSYSTCSSEGSWLTDYNEKFCLFDGKSVNSYTHGRKFFRDKEGHTNWLTVIVLIRYETFRSVL